MLTSKERAELRSQATTIDTTLMVGKGGVTDAVIAEAENQLNARELVKGKVLEGAMMTPREVCDEICRKMIIRHPHVFGDRVFDGEGKPLKDWEAIKANSHSFTTATQTLEAIPRTLPALMRADKLGKKSRKFGFDWEPEESMLKVDEEVLEVKSAIAEGSFEHIEEEFGDLLLSVVNAARLSGIDPELALTKACEKYLRRFASVEKQSHDLGRKINENSRDELLSYWKKAKKSVT